MDVELYLFSSLKKGNSLQWRRECLKQYLQKRGEQSPDLEFSYTEKGKPYLKGRESPSFSVSHSGDLWCCGISSLPLGVDIEKKTPREYERLARRFFHPEEYAFLEEKEFSQFFLIWTAKESYLKYTGEGLGGGLSSFSVVAEGGLAPQVNGVFLQPFSLSTGYQGCLSSFQPAEIKFFYKNEKRG